MREQYVLIKVDFNLGNFLIHILKSIEIGGILQVMIYNGDGTWRVLKKSLIEVAPTLKISIAQEPKWIILAESDDIHELIEVQKEEYIKHCTMRELTT